LNKEIRTGIGKVMKMEEKETKKEFKIEKDEIENFKAYTSNPQLKESLFGNNSEISSPKFHLTFLHQLKIIRLATN
jgi:hypothetical protein